LNPSHPKVKTKWILSLDMREIEDMPWHLATNPVSLPECTSEEQLLLQT
jgi:hypothetical protein